jgi:DNA (cytosine-5)-methyltransferase 1
MAAYYNEIEPFAAAWLRNLIAAGHIAAGDVDERSITDVQPDDLKGYTQCHFFAGIGGWSLALRMACWPDDEHAWSGSCPCQPLSSAGQRKGHADERHLWPAFHRLIAECHPATVFGEQVAGKDGYEWLAGIRADLEGSGYACGAADLCAAGAGAPHLRQRLFWVADCASERRREAGGYCVGPEGRSGGRGAAWMADAISERICRSGLGPAAGTARGSQAAERQREWVRANAGAMHGTYGLGDATGEGRQGQRRVDRASCAGNRGQSRPSMQDDIPAWNGATIAVERADGWARIAAEPALFPVAARIPGDVGRLRGSGNAIVPQVAAEFVSAFMECAP